jgi:predicted HicB family RNase H-like nuclease
MSTIEYRDYQALVSYEDGRLMCKVINAREDIIFYGNSVDELKKEMEVAIEQYLKQCAEQGVEPAKSYSGKFNVRLDPELHKKLALVASRQGISLNQLVSDLLTEDIEQLDGDKFWICPPTKPQQA